MGDMLMGFYCTRAPQICANIYAQLSCENEWQNRGYAAEFDNSETF
jgi:hypothetical protein